MRLTPLSLIAATLLTVSARASSVPLVLDSVAVSEPESSKPAPELVRLDHDLTSTQQARQKGRIAPERYEEFVAQFRTDLEAARTQASPSPANVALHARMLARLGEFKSAAASLGRALKRDSDNADLRVALSQVRFDEKNYPAALAEADAVLGLDPANKEALALKHFSEGRVAMNGDEGVNPSSPLPPPATRRSFARRFHFRAADPATLPFKLPVKISPAIAPPALTGHGTAPAAPGPLPLLPLAGVAALGLAAYEVSRSRAAYVSTDGLDDEHPKPVGRYQRLVAGTILAGALGAKAFASRTRKSGRSIPAN